MHLSARESVEALVRARDAPAAATAEVTPHHLVLTDEAVRTLDPNRKMNPPLRAEADRGGAVAALRSGEIGSRRLRPRPARAHEKDVPVRGRAVRRDRARDGVRGALRTSSSRASSTSRRCSSA